ncbi:hypothetical protein [Streptomyces venezuelae]|uniref:hypothetical protein n=1 Tax=Streptomyces venezuelae TaxID=54571 RepID=UPI001CC23DF1|nr:hypothetical protein [Streptomyces venezuelae]
MNVRVIANICRQSDEDVAQLELVCLELTSDPAESVRGEAAAILLQLRPSIEDGPTSTRSS